MLIQPILWKSALVSGAVRRRNTMRWVSRLLNAFYAEGLLFPDSREARSKYLTTLRNRPTRGSDL
jgi:hypothetical protein